MILLQTLMKCLPHCYNRVANMDAGGLKTRHYRNGEPITFVPINDSIQWKELSKGAYSENTDGTVFSNNPVGLLYNWYVAVDTLQVCPQGWHVPTCSEWDTLCSVLSKSINDEIIKFFNINGNAYRLEGGKVVVVGQPNIMWWASTTDNSEKAHFCKFNFGIHSDRRGKKAGLNIRCIKDK
jgi:hypothetical protein